MTGNGGGGDSPDVDLVSVVSAALAGQTVGELGKGTLIVSLIGGPYDGALATANIAGWQRGIEMFLPVTQQSPLGVATYAFYKVRVGEGDAIFSHEKSGTIEQISANPPA